MEDEHLNQRRCKYHIGCTGTDGDYYHVVVILFCDELLLRGTIQNARWLLWCRYLHMQYFLDCRKEPPQVVCKFERVK